MPEEVMGAPNAEGITKESYDALVRGDSDARQGYSGVGVKRISMAGGEPQCPKCGKRSLKMHMNKPTGQRIYCSASDCDYDTSRTINSKKVKVGQEPEPVTKTQTRSTMRGITKSGVKVKTSRG